MKLLSSSQAAFQFLWKVGEWCQRMSKEISGLVRSLFKQCLLENLWKPWLIFLNHAVKGVPVFWPRPASLSGSWCLNRSPMFTQSFTELYLTPKEHIPGLKVGVQQKKKNTWTHQTWLRSASGNCCKLSTTLNLAVPTVVSSAEVEKLVAQHRNKSSRLLNGAGLNPDSQNLDLSEN